MPIKVIMPKLGESVIEGTVNQWLKHEGEAIQEYESLLEVETAKVTTEIPSPAGGVILKILVQEGETVNVGITLAWIGQPGEEIPGESDGTPEALSPDAQKFEKNLSPKNDSLPHNDLGFISPVVAKLAAENKLDLALVTGTGDKGRITKKDVLEYLKQDQPGSLEKTGEAPWETPGSGDLFKPTDQPYTPLGKPGANKIKPVSTLETTGDQVIPLTSKRKVIAEHMLSSKRTSAHVTTVMEADLSRIAEHKQTNRSLLERDGMKLTYTPYFVAATALALAENPGVNSSWSEKGIMLHRSINIGVAVSLGDEGLIVPVIHQADHMSLVGLAKTINELAEKARTKKLTPDETTGGTFSITNHGTGRSLFATPIINQPQCAILGVGAITKRAVVINDAIAIRLMVYLSLTFDHRILDGAAADEFLAKIVDTLENWK